MQASSAPSRTRDLVRVAMFAALVAVLGLLPPVPVPVIPVPITAQTMGVMLAGSLLGAKRGGQALLLFLVLVALGLPVLAGGRGGFGVLAGPSGGFVVAWPAAAWCIGWLAQRVWPRYNALVGTVINLAGGIGVVYAIGIPWTAAVTSVPLIAAAAGAAVFIPGDIVKAVLAAMIAAIVRRGYPMIRP